MEIVHVFENDKKNNRNLELILNKALFRTCSKILNKVLNSVLKKVL